MPFSIYYEQIDAHDSACVRGKIGDAGGYDLQDAISVARAHMKVEAQEYGGEMEITRAGGGGGGDKIEVGDEDAGITMTAWVSDAPIKWSASAADLEEWGVQVILEDIAAKGSAKRAAEQNAAEEPSEAKTEAKKPKIHDSRVIVAHNPGVSHNTSGALGFSWAAQLKATLWGHVPGLIEALPTMPTAGAHSPYNENVLKAFMTTPLPGVRCVIVAKYPYTDAKIATGLALSPGVPTPSITFHKSVLFKALAQDKKLNFNGRQPLSQDLSRWATDAGVLLLNASLQDEKANMVWKPFLTKAIGAICRAADTAKTPVGFIFIGAEAKKLTSAVKGISARCVEECAYPAMQWTAPFVADPPFSKVDEKLVRNGTSRIAWEVLLD